MMDFETTVKLALYRFIADKGALPESSDLAAVLACPPADVELAFAQLAAKRLLVFEPRTTSRLRMAPPFSGIETPFPVLVGKTRYYANCIWDAFGIAAALRVDVRVDATDGHTGEPLTLEVKEGSPPSSDYVAHFAVPAARWWEDIIYT